ncbi:MAG: hypothetical protein OQJ93_02065 [Ignavibacteriaceae bacterium]|jgi:hypothetical protein|nr:hypothetical protein [Ignavibacteriaceae bacterium]MCW8813668.1 hypothetical protein [Chlorobium sp.]MCW8994671.1 hypothetical protein [Psychromonas sp.]MCW8818159.1 hypothetical protein [Ignavibacteriaceae bacterium]MCW8822941.1 hypothetical protein [Ignavibacteriaceae bacterium]
MIILNSKKRILNIIGLMFGMFGVVIIFFYGPPQPSFFPYDIITDDNIHREILEMRDKYDLYSKIGLVFIGGGFLLQLLSACFSDSVKESSNKSEDKFIISQTPDVTESIKE